MEIFWRCFLETELVSSKRPADLGISNCSNILCKAMIGQSGDWPRYGRGIVTDVL